MLISVIVPIYKVEQYLPRCIDSLINQDSHNIEIILIDDGSPDNCGRIIDDYARKYSNIHVVHQSNSGLSAARNAGIDVAQGDYLMFVDSDDYVEPNFCSYAVNKALETQSDIVIFGYNDIFSDKKVVHTFALEDEMKYSSEGALFELLGGKLLSFAWNKIYKSSLFHRIRYPVGRLFEDIGTTYLLFDAANSIYLASGVTYNYQKRNTSILGQKMSERAAIDWFEMAFQAHSYVAHKYPNLQQRSLAYLLGVTVHCLIVLNGYQGFVTKKRKMESLILQNKDFFDKKKIPLQVRMLIRNKRLYKILGIIKRHIYG